MCNNDLVIGTPKRWGKLLYRYMTWWRFHCMSFLQNSLHLLPSLPFIPYFSLLSLLSAAEEILRYRMVLFCVVQKGSAWDSMKMIFRFLVHHKIFSHGIDVLFSSCLLELLTIAKKKQRKFDFFGYQCLTHPPRVSEFFINILKFLWMWCEKYFEVFRYFLNFDFFIKNIFIFFNFYFFKYFIFSFIFCRFRKIYCREKFIKIFI